MALLAVSLLCVKLKIDSAGQPDADPLTVENYGVKAMLFGF
jgi:hypothetical protein